jgi:hypothetical protein
MTPVAGAALAAMVRGMASSVERDIALDRPTVCTMCTVESTTERVPGGSSATARSDGDDDDQGAL